ncbi:MAG: hypothetical protein KKB90_03190 [Actinobacteria bacterium]|nr:hypothetical protein [Actinomycetota bacterium]MCG2817467.1 hypothetical protein [Actinomycetes bacterium]MBU4179951.1 hypothetical protein [Actinomycetota bacterium]MBU4217950.1 hypothetical protein [Actinomycetota bacterium]MBU4357936.1 hypothetical protein [Actinomycetota bacterium]
MDQKNSQKRLIRKKRVSRFIDYATLVIHELFFGTLAVYIFLLLIEEIKKGFVSDFLNLNILVAVVLATGVITMFTYEEKTIMRPDEKSARQAGVEILLVVALGLFTGFLVLIRIAASGRIGGILAIGVGLIAIILSPSLVQVSNPVHDVRD